jgi:hypothetical protein
MMRAWISPITPEGSAVPDVDARGFAYALEPARQKQQWRLDGLMSELARARQALAGLEARMSEIMDRHDRAAEAATQTLRHRLSPESHRRTLEFLAHLRGQWQALSTERDRRRDECDRLRGACARQQLRIESLSRHREEALAAYAGEMRHRLAVERDNDWLARWSLRDLARGSGC